MKKSTSVKSSEPGYACPKCNKPMQRREHPAGWKPQAAQPYYFLFWDTCKACRHIQHYEAAKVHIDDNGRQDRKHQTRNASLQA